MAGKSAVIEGHVVTMVGLCYCTDAPKCPRLNWLLGPCERRSSEEMLGNAHQTARFSYSLGRNSTEFLEERRYIVRVLCDIGDKSKYS